MPSYHVVAAAVAMPDGGARLLSSISPGRMARYTSPRPAGTFQWPMDDMTREQGELAMTYEELLHYVHGTGRTYWCGRFYKNYNGLVDAYITFAHSGRYYHFIMDYPPEHVVIGEDYDGYPRPTDFYLARNAIMTGTSWTIAEYDADAPMPAGPIPAALPAVPIVALPPIAENMQGEVAIDEGLIPFSIFIFIKKNKNKNINNNKHKKLK